MTDRNTNWAGAGGDRPAARRASDRWLGLGGLIRARLLVATLALPVGVLLRPEATETSWWVLWWALIAIGILSAVYGLGVRLQRGLTFQTAMQLAGDVLLVTALSAWTGGRDSQFVLFFGLVVITGGLLGRMAGGILTALGACAAFIALPWIASQAGVPVTDGAESAILRPNMVVAFLAIVGVLSGLLGERVQHTRDALHRTARELSRVRVDNDVILRHLASGVLTVDQSGIITFVNPAAEQVLGVRMLEARGRDVREALPDRLEPLRKLVRETLEDQFPRARVELMMRSVASRQLPVGASTNVLHHDGVMSGVVAVFQDLSEVREMERLARRNQTLAEVGALAAGIAHELRNGLNPISGSVEVLQRELKLEGEHAVLMDLIARESTRLHRFVTDLLSYTRERDLVPEPVNLDEHLATLCDDIRRDSRRGADVAVRYDRPGTEAVVRVDREQLRQVWLNLAANAFEAIGPRGSLTVRWTAAPDEGVAVEFQDDGSGIAATDLPQVAQPFFTTKQGGTGLGLAIAQRIVERHGGMLVLESELGKGTTARVTLPAASVHLLQAA
jgi:two-component system sensor histidine kinase PilS (NtrC family)